ncbi:MAG: ATP-binding cassette domain-containing protein [Burkholderiales bacterium]|nr:ATP-binding cassette domain-containing protein [Burkholderiales bacterium]MCA3162651.1 ATP-binding cassette domain-containing protein [Burkholderiales bacterium]MCA3164143.1 ATP-binding cassette domain-containing protein [Burkholderiales bacterium]MCA3166208.1 ATP-binding cassette domain-containing protein [Burkholderiales bacterium]MCA3169139.1 ATP-binding cassette domain-containing protein [Burkholderiales bacterium]
MITLDQVTLRRGARVLLDQASVALNPGEKIGLIGRNGSGKSSLFALLTGRLQEDGGDCHVPAHWLRAEVAQDMPNSALSATDYVMTGDVRLEQARAALHRAEQSGDGEAMALAHAAWSDADGHGARPRAQALCLGLGFAVTELDLPVQQFSGGWRMRLQLARALMCPADLLLLDEPTNHLDLDALVWLENWLQKFHGTLIVISHDREFLDAVTNVTLLLNHAQLSRYGGNYSAYEQLRAQQLSLQQAAYEKQQDKIAHLQKFIDRFKAKATKAKQAQSRVKALERMEKLAPVLAQADFSFEFPEPEQCPNPMLALKDASFGYGEKIILHDVRRTLLAGQRIGILGANGQGKSTLVKTLAQVQPLLAGEMVEGKGLRLGYFAQQELDILQPDSTPLEHLVRLAKQCSPQAREQDLRNFLGSFRFEGERMHQAVGTLSGGEKARLVLALLVWQRPNLLVLDEPTNHLDLTTREALSLALNEFEGAVLLVSHDRALLREVCDEFWLVAQGQVASFDGDLDDYQRYLLDEAKRRQSEQRGTHVVAKRPARSNDQSRQIKAWNKELAAVEKQMEQLQAERTALEAALGATTHPLQLAETGKQLQAVTETLTTLENRWLELSTQMESPA